MLIPIGFFGGGAAAGAYELISTTVLGTDVADVTFTSIPSTYKHLQIRYTARASGDGLSIYGQFNGVTASSYVAHYLLGSGAGVSSHVYPASTSLNLGNIAADAAGASFSTGVLDILDYASSTKNKTTRNLHGYATDAGNRIALQSGLFLDTTAISSIKLFHNIAFKTGSRFSLYGIKGA